MPFDDLRVVPLKFPFVSYPCTLVPTCEHTGVHELKLENVVAWVAWHLYVWYCLPFKLLGGLKEDIIHIPEWEQMVG